MTDDSSAPLLSHVFVPVATEKDARETAVALAPYDPERVTVVHVVEKGGGVPDKTPVEQSESIAATAFEAFRERFPDAETETVYRRNVVQGIVDAAAETGASAIAFQPREGGRLKQFLSGDRTLRLVTDADRPVITLPGRTE
ncbi:MULTISPECIES: universal stress protein [Halolamina]|uniref:Universal stress protein family protein n=1 Tax=Halolamina pelagica TaxID=699431 RepID=A0A1I5M631_9EURY|nr:MULTISPECIES: universal stress protein [Halolamina]NHX35880.1 universal stress protein [Halolamina sp. R1-12]SFP04970.1 Universal stress protein family protein [Halolamina pelagica]